MVIPTHDRPAALTSCLETLQHQDLAASDLEVVVVDDGSEGDIASVVQRSAATAPFGLRCERQPLSGLNSARNRGVAVTTGDVIAFLDDDTLVSPGWATAILRAFEDHPCAGLGGLVELGLEAPEPPWMGELRYYLAAYDLGGEARWLEDDPVPVGANCAVRRSEIERVGGFRTGLDRIGRSLVSNGDTEFFRRLRSAGGRLRYEPRAAVVHCVPPDRLTVEFFTRRHRAQGVSDELLRHLEEGHPATLGHRVGLARETVRAARSLAADFLLRRDRIRSRFLVAYWSARLGATRLPPPAA